MIQIVRKSTLRFTRIPSLVLIRLVLTEIQRFKNVKINKGMYGIRTLFPDGHTFLCKFCHFQMAVLLTFGSIYTQVGDFVKLGLHFMTMWNNSC